MRLLLIEDDENKRTKIESFLQETFPNVIITSARSFQGGLRELITKAFDVIIADMSMPTFDIIDDDDGGRHQPFAGKDLLGQMDRRGIRIPTIVITRFDRFGDNRQSLNLKELDSQLFRSFSDIYCGVIYFDDDIGEWKSVFKGKINDIVNLKNTNGGVL